MANRVNFDQQAYWPAFRAALVWQSVLGVLAALMLDFGQTAQAWAVALLCHAAIVALILCAREPRRVLTS